MDPSTAPSSQLREITAVLADEAIKSGAASLLDVREPDEFVAGHTPAAHSIPLGELEARVSELANNATIICICRSGSRSAAAAAALSALGFDAVNLQGGMHAWAAEGLAVTTLSGAPGRVI